MDFFLCFLLFLVHPLVQVPNQLVGAPVLTDVTLICNVEASPKAINYWQRENGKFSLTHTQTLISTTALTSFGFSCSYFFGFYSFFCFNHIHLQMCLCVSVYRFTIFHLYGNSFIIFSSFCQFFT